LTFTPDGPATTRCARVPHKELRDEVVEKYHAIEGGEQTLNKLAAYVTEIVRTKTVRNELRLMAGRCLQRVAVAGWVHRSQGLSGN